MRVRRHLYALLIVLGTLAGCGSTPGGASDPGGGADEPNPPGGPTTGPDEATGPALHDVIAYVAADGGDEIRLIDPDGANDRSLWTHGRADPSDVHEIWSLAWRPDARAVAFASTHEAACSVDPSDLYVVGTDGSGYRRVTMGPACDALDAYEKGTVRIPVQNDSVFSESIDVFLYFIGAPSVKQVSLPPGGTTMVTIEDVADFGDVMQYGVVIQGTSRALLASTAADVQAGGTVETSMTGLYAPGTPGFEVRDPTWRADGSLLGYAFSFNGLHGIAPDSGPMAWGDTLAEPEGMPTTVFHLAYGPSPERADELLYDGWSFDESGIYLIAEGSDDPGELLVSHESYEGILGLAWLPDGSGFVYAVEEDFSARSNIYRYDFGSGERTPVTAFTDSFAGRLAVSPDGDRVVFERASALDTSDDLVDPALWIVSMDGSDPSLLVEQARAPAWSR